MARGLHGKGGVYGERGHAWQRRACVVKGGMHGKGVCVAKGACMGYNEIWRYNQ